MATQFIAWECVPGKFNRLDPVYHTFIGSNAVSRIRTKHFWPNCASLLTLARTEADFIKLLNTQICLAQTILA